MPVKRKVFAFWLGMETKKELEKMAQKTDVSIAHLIRSAIKEFLERSKSS